MRTVINAATVADHILVPVKPNVKYVVENLQASAAGAVNATFKSGTTPITGPQSMVDGSHFVLPDSPDPNGQSRGWFETAYGEALVMELDAAIQVGGSLTYREEVNPRA